MPAAISMNHRLWDFSVHQYARPGVSQLCLALQDEHGINVNLLLWALWLGFNNQMLTADLLSTAQEKIRPWDKTFVEPLRALRRQIKATYGVADPAIEAVRQQIKMAELTAEKYMLHLLEEISCHTNTPNSASQEIKEKHVLLKTSLLKSNLAMYLNVCEKAESHINSLIQLIDLNYESQQGA